MRLLATLIQLYIYVLFFRAILSWFPNLQNPTIRQIAVFAFQITEPVLAPVRRLMAPIRLGGTSFDFSILVVMIILQYLRNFFL